jgi:uncharacterized protein YhbP (UPF0306 family)
MMKDIKTLINEVLEKSHLMTLGTLDEGGPWVSNVVFIYDEDLNIYWMSDPNVRHSMAILKNPKISGTISVNNKSKEPNIAIQFSGIANKIEEKRFDLAKKHLAKRGYPEPKESDDILQGDAWYVLKPDFIDLTHEELFGFNKKKLILKNE